jgi:pyruvate dehydrogenase E1 component beta subunit
MTRMNIVEAVNRTLADEMERDERVIVLGQDVGRLGGVFRATDGLLDRFGENRVIDMPLAEGAIAGSAVGLAVSGLIPVIEMQFLGFALQAFHQIGPQIARFRYRSQGRFALPITIRAPFGGGVRTPELHSDALEAQFITPGLKVVMPATPTEAQGLLAEAIRDPDPVLFCEPLRGYRLFSEDVPEQSSPIPFGRARVVRGGSDVTIIAWSAAVAVAEAAAEALQREGISATVLDLRTLSPLDIDSIRDSVQETGRAVVVHEAPHSGGFGGEVVATIMDEAFYSLEAPVVRVTAPDTPYPLAGVEEIYLPSAVRVVKAVKGLWDDRG